MVQNDLLQKFQRTARIKAHLQVAHSSFDTDQDERVSASIPPRGEFAANVAIFDMVWNDKITEKSAGQRQV